MRALVVAMALAFPAAAFAGTPVTVSSFTPQIKEDAVARAVEIFKSACSPLADKYWGDVVSAKAKSYESYADYRVRGYGWVHEIEIEIQLAENPKSIPNSFMAAGHKLGYFVGGGTKPGIIAQKRQSQALCGMEVDQRGCDVFKPVPALSVIGK